MYHYRCQMTPDELASHPTVDLTTCGRKTGHPRRLEIWWFRVAGVFYITGTVGPRDWLANLRTNPRAIIHVGTHNIAVEAYEVTDLPTRRAVLSDPQLSWYSTQQELDQLVADSPMVRISFDGDMT